MTRARSSSAAVPTTPRLGASGAQAAEATPTLAGSRRALIVAPSGSALAAGYGALVADLVARRHRVLTLAPGLAEPDAAALVTLGAETRDWPTKASFLRALADRHEASGLRALIADWQPHVALVQCADATLPALAAARAARVARVLAFVDGLPALLRGAGQRRWRRAFDGIDGAAFTSRDDARALSAASVLGAGLPPAIVTGGGIDLDRHAQQPLPGLGEGLVFAMIAAPGSRTGIAEFLAAAAAVSTQAPNARFLLAGATARDVDATAGKAHAGSVQVLGPVADTRTVFARAHVVVHPARDGGTPGTVLEALAAGRPVITSDLPGCRETVDERVNGCLVPPGDAVALAEAMVSFLRRPDLIASMARAARVKAERRYDQRAATVELRALLGL